MTSDPWAFLRHYSRSLLSKESSDRAAAYVDQAFEFFEAASNPRTSSRPLLYYYSFLNLAKVLLLHKGGYQIPLLVQHGVRDPRANVKERLRFEGQTVHINEPVQTHDQLFPEFVKALSGPTAVCGRNFRIVDLLRQIPGVHRTYGSVMEDRAYFCPVKSIEYYSDGNQVWAQLHFEAADKDVREALSGIRRSQRFRRILDQVAGGAEDKICFETQPAAGTRRGIDTAIGKVSEGLREIGFSALLTDSGYRYYLGDFAPRDLMPQLCCVYAVMFYLGSITRYKPHHFDSIVSKDYQWLVAEFLETQPTQFLYLLASHVAGVEVTKPFAALGRG